jgi:signal transduction histidine kinase
MIGAQRPWRRLQGLDHRLVDGLLVAVLAAGAVAEALHGHQQQDQLIHVLPVVLIIVPLFWRRRWPIAVALVQFAGMFLVLSAPLIASVLAVFVGIYSVGLYSPHRLASLALPIGFAALLAAVGIPGDFYTSPVPAWAAVLAGGAGLWLAGSAVRDLEERAGRLERERALAGRLAAAGERARIARELHDQVAHSVSVMVVQAGAARTVVGTRPERAAEALRTVETGGREALAELRHLLGTLGDSGDETALAPQPGLDQLDTLVGRLGTAGLPVTVHLEGVPRAVPPGADLTAYRIVQEALTNVLRHAGGAPAEVTLRFGPEELVVEITNGPGRALPAAPGAGRGLLGMRERAAVYGGDVEAAPQEDGGFGVRARIPLDAAP